MNQKTQEPKLTTMRLHEDAVRALKKAEKVCRSKKKMSPTHSEALRMASAAWEREMKSESASEVK